MAAKEKKYLLRVQVPAFHMPAWPELAVSKLWPIIQNDEAFMEYFPGKLPKGKVPEKHFFWGVFMAIKPGYVKCLMKDAIEQRNVLPQAGEPDATKLLQIDSTLLQKMLEAPIFMSKSPDT